MTDHDALLNTAISRSVRADGYTVTAQRLKAQLATLRFRAKLDRILTRILQAREKINLRAIERFEVHDDEAAEIVMDQATPDYPERAADDAWLRANCGYGIDEDVEV